MPDDRLLAARSLIRSLTPKWTKYIPIKPNVKQHIYLCLDHVLDVFFGGAAGPGKSVALLAGALQYVDEPDYAALIVRRNYMELTQADGLIDVSHEWLDGTDATWNENLKRWSFPPHGNTLQFGHMDNAMDKRRYKGAQYQFIGIDEVTDFEERDAMFLFSRLRRKMGSKIPLRFRSASNPGGVGHDWVKRRYVDAVGAERLFIPATMSDNPHLDVASYLKSLANLDPVTRERLIKGDWLVTDGGSLFDRSWWKTFFRVPPVEVVGRVRGWDLAATCGDDSKETAGVLMSRTTKGLYVIESVIHGKWHPGDRDDMIVSTAWADGEYVHQVVEEEPGSGGIAQNDSLIRKMSGRRATSIKVTGKKAVRAGPLSSQVQAGNVALIEGIWNSDFIDQLHNVDPVTENMPMDMMDAASLAFNALPAYPLGGAVETGGRLVADRNSQEFEDEQDRIAIEEAKRDSARGTDMWEDAFGSSRRTSGWENLN
jgi:predicted phage terminase large subunit-like protein